MHEYTYISAAALPIALEMPERLVAITSGAEEVDDIAFTLRGVQDSLTRCFCTHLLPLHSLRLESFSWTLVQSMLDSYFSVTTDAGVESLS